MHTARLFVSCLQFGRKTLHKLRKQVLRHLADPMPACSHQHDQQQQQQQLRQPGAAGRQVAMIYGALPPEARRMQAALFNAAAASRPAAQMSVLVASDAVGMGLNLNIRRCVCVCVCRRGDWRRSSLQKLSTFRPQHVASTHAVHHLWRCF